MHDAPKRDPADLDRPRRGADFRRAGRAAGDGAGAVRELEPRRHPTRSARSTTSRSSGSGIETYPTTGQLDLTIVSVTSGGLPAQPAAGAAVVLAADRDALPRDAVYPPGTSRTRSTRARRTMETAQDDAGVAALRAEGQPVDRDAGGVLGDGRRTGPRRAAPRRPDRRRRRQERPRGRTTDGTDRRHQGGGEGHFRGAPRNKTTVQGEHRRVADPERSPVVGITLGKGYHYAPEISFDLGQRIGGPSAGLVFALAIYDKITPGRAARGRTSPARARSLRRATWGRRRHPGEDPSAEKAGATAFLVPPPTARTSPVSVPT